MLRSLQDLAPLRPRFVSPVAGLHRASPSAIS